MYTFFFYNHSPYQTIYHSEFLSRPVHVLFFWTVNTYTVTQSNNYFITTFLVIYTFSFSIFSGRTLNVSGGTLCMHTICLWQLSLRLKLFPQKLQLNGFSPVCVLMCIFRCAFDGKIFLQHAHSSALILYALLIFDGFWWVSLNCSVP